MAGQTESSSQPVMPAALTLTDTALSPTSRRRSHSPAVALKPHCRIPAFGATRRSAVADAVARPGYRANDAQVSGIGPAQYATYLPTGAVGWDQRRAHLVGVRQCGNRDAPLAHVRRQGWTTASYDGVRMTVLQRYYRASAEFLVPNGLITATPFAGTLRAVARGGARRRSATGSAGGPNWHRRR
jgi:hypothetical protein